MENDGHSGDGETSSTIKSTTHCPWKKQNQKGSTPPTHVIMDSSIFSSFTIFLFLNLPSLYRVSFFYSLVLLCFTFSLGGPEWKSRKKFWLGRHSIPPGKLYSRVLFVLDCLHDSPFCSTSFFFGLFFATVRVTLLLFARLGRSRTQTLLHAWESDSSRYDGMRLYDRSVITIAIFFLVWRCLYLFLLHHHVYLASEEQANQRERQNSVFLLQTQELFFFVSKLSLAALCTFCRLMGRLETHSGLMDF